MSHALLSDIIRVTASFLNLSFNIGDVNSKIAIEKIDCFNMTLECLQVSGVVHSACLFQHVKTLNCTNQQVYTVLGGGPSIHGRSDESKELNEVKVVIDCCIGGTGLDLVLNSRPPNDCIRLSLIFLFVSP
jgi:hypothetical protein